MAEEAKRLAPDDTLVRDTCKKYYQQSIDNPNEMKGEFQEAKENYFYETYQVLPYWLHCIVVDYIVV